jgi:hypothetical protein
MEHSLAPIKGPRISPIIRRMRKCKKSFIEEKFCCCPEAVESQRSEVKYKEESLLDAKKPYYGRNFFVRIIDVEIEAAKINRKDEKEKGKIY